MKKIKRNHTKEKNKIKEERGFTKKVRAVVAAIPKGEVRTYKEVAEQAGSPGAARAVGTIMSNNFDKTVPCHRVIRGDGKVGNYNRGGEEAKRALLKKEKAI